MACMNFTEVADPVLQEVAGNHTFAADLSKAIRQKILPTVCVFGTVGNILNLTILTRRKLQKSFRTLERAANLCLIALALSDLLFCIFAFPTMFMPLDNRFSSGTGPLIMYSIYCGAIINVFIMESTLLTVVMSLERFVAICFPLRQDLYMTPRRTKYVIAFTAIFSVVFNLPVIWRYKKVAHCRHLVPLNGSDVGLASSVNQTLSHLAFLSGAPVSNLQGSAGLSSTSPTAYDATNISGQVGIMAASLQECASNFRCSSSADTSSSNNSNSRGLLSLLTSSSLPTVKSKFNSSLSPVSSLVAGSAFSSSSTSVPTVPFNADSIASLSKNLTQIYTDIPSASPAFYTVAKVNLGNSIQVDTAYRYAWAVAGNIVPLILLFYFNGCLWWKIYLSYKMRRQFFHRTGPQQHAPTPRSSHIITVTLVAIVVMFFILVAPSEIAIHAKDMMVLEEDTKTAIEDVLNLMQTINFSANFILYCIISPYFRKALKSFMFCGYNNMYQVSKEWKKDYQTSLM